MKYELTHDSLASKIEEMVSDEQKIRRKMLRFLNDQYAHYQSREVLLDKEDMEYIRPYLNTLPLDESIRRFVQKSEAALKRRQRILMAIVAAIVLIISVLGLRAWFESQRYQSQYLNARARQVLADDPTAALRISEAAWQIDDNDAIREDMFHIYRHHTFYATLLRLHGPVISGVRDANGMITTVTQTQMEPEAWDNQGKAAGKLLGHIHPVYDMAISEHGFRVSAGNDKTAILWDQDGQQLQVFRSEEGLQGADIRAVDISADGTRVLTGASDGQVKMWQRGVDTALLRVNIGHEIKDISFGKDGRAFAVASSAPAAGWFLAGENGWTEQPLSGHLGGVDAVRISPDGRLAATGGNDHIVRLWAVNGDSVVLIREIGQHRGSINTLAFSPDMNWLISGSADSTARVWALEGKANFVLKGHTGGVSSVSVGEDNMIMTTSLDSTVRLWKMPAPFAQTTIEVHRRGISAVAISNDDQRIITGGKDHRVSLLDLESRQKIWEHREHQDEVVAVGFGEANTVISVDLYGRVMKVDADNQEMVGEFSAGEDELLSAAFSADGSLLITGSADSTMRLWSVADGETLLELPHPGMVFAVAISPKQGLLLTGCEDSLAYLWDRQGNLIRTLAGHQGEVLATAFTPGNQLILTGSQDQHIILWDQKGRKIRTYHEYAKPISSISMNSDETLLLAGYKDKLAVLFDVEGYAIGDLPGHGDFVNVVLFSPDGQHIATASDDKNLRIWDDIKPPLKIFLQKGSLNKMDATMKTRFRLE